MSYMGRIEKKERGIYMKKKNIAMLMTMAMITSGVTAPMEAVYASDEIQIQSEDVFESEMRMHLEKVQMLQKLQRIHLRKVQSPKRQICRKPKR